MFAEKGKRGYLRGRKTKLAMIMLGLLLIIIGLVALGMWLNKGDRKNIYTVMAVLTVLPLANLLTTFIAVFPYKAPEEKEFSDLAGPGGCEHILTELAVTNAKLKTIYFPYVVVNEDQLFAYTKAVPAEGKKQEYIDAIEGYMAAGGCQATVHIYTEMTAFQRIAKQNQGQEPLTEKEKRVVHSLLTMAL